MAATSNTPVSVQPANQAVVNQHYVNTVSIRIGDKVIKTFSPTDKGYDQLVKVVTSKLTNVDMQDAINAYSKLFANVKPDTINAGVVVYDTKDSVYTVSLSCIVNVRIPAWIAFRALYDQYSSLDNAERTSKTTGQSSKSTSNDSDIAPLEAF